MGNGQVTLGGSGVVLGKNELFKMIKSNVPTLTRLDLSNNHFNEDDFIALGDVLCYNTTLRELSLDKKAKLKA
ncbi:hypothetical protein JG641_18730, partial [Vibrio cholerae]|uniref:hypothetical protein n=1 Tax=Vibrio cholerae TaxID=666 RepID=UPI0018F067F0